LRFNTLGCVNHHHSAIKHDDVAYFVADYLLQYYPDNIKSRFQLEQLPETEQALLDVIGKQRGCLRAKGQIDQDKAAKILLSELRSGTLGRLTLETPEMMALELAELMLIRLEKEEKKKQRKQHWQQR
jgi:ribosome biogenesis GTPase A